MLAIGLALGFDVWGWIRIGREIGAPDSSAAQELQDDRIGLIPTAKTGYDPRQRLARWEHAKAAETGDQ